MELTLFFPENLGPYNACFTISGWEPHSHWLFNSKATSTVGAAVEAKYLNLSLLSKSSSLWGHCRYFTSTLITSLEFKKAVASSASPASHSLRGTKQTMDEHLPFAARKYTQTQTQECGSEQKPPSQISQLHLKSHLA